MSEPFLNEMSEDIEGTEALSRATQELNEITNEPESYVVGKINVAQSEAIESSFNELVNTAQQTHQGEMKALPLPIPMPVEADEVECDPIPLPYPISEADEEERSTAKSENELIETLPSPLPNPKEEREVASSSTEGVVDGSVPASEDAWESPNVHEAINPDPIYRESGDASIDPRPIIMESGEIEGADESPERKAQEPTLLLTDNEILAIQNQIETNTKDFMIVSVLTESAGSAEKNAISNIK